MRETAKNNQRMGMEERVGQGVLCMGRMGFGNANAIEQTRWDLAGWNG